MACTILLALLISFGLRFAGIQHPEPFLASSRAIFLLLGLPVLIAGLFVFLLGFKEI